MSLPTRERGLKQYEGRSELCLYSVAPHAGAWIETLRNQLSKRLMLVAPHAGAWIETKAYRKVPRGVTVAPHAGAWIETILSKRRKNFTHVAPHAGAWIETSHIATRSCSVGRSPRGSVD